MNIILNSCLLNPPKSYTLDLKCHFNSECNIPPRTHLKWLNVELDYVGEASGGAFGHHQLCVEIHPDVIEVLRLQRSVISSTARLAP